jgi:hypothetical protein
LKNPHDLNRSFAVEIPRGFIGEQDLRLINESTGNCHALLLSTGELTREVVRALRQTHNVECVQSPVSHIFAAAALPPI